MSSILGIGKTAVKPTRYNTRIAPSPTGHAHIGTFRTALFCFLAARASDGTFTLRIDDTDTNRNDESAVAPIINALEWLRMDTDRIFRQSSRIDVYQEVAVGLVRAGLATVLSNGAIALKWHPDMPKEWTDNIAGPMKVSQTNIDQIDGRLILLKGKDNKFAPTYQFASAYDDRDYNINYIIRGTDHISNTPKQLAIWWALNGYAEHTMPFPEWAHVGLIFKDGKKLSKRDGASSVLEWRTQGYLPETLLAFMLRLGWAPKLDNKENDMLQMHEAMDMFLTQGKMKNSSANMDVKKLAAYERKMRARIGKELCGYEDDRSSKQTKKLANGEVRHIGGGLNAAFADVVQDVPNAGVAKLSHHGQRYIDRLEAQLHPEPIFRPFGDPIMDADAAVAAVRVAPPIAPNLDALEAGLPQGLRRAIPDNPGPIVRGWGLPLDNEGALRIQPIPVPEMRYQPAWNAPRDNEVQEIIRDYAERAQRPQNVYNNVVLVRDAPIAPPQEPQAEQGE